MLVLVDLMQARCFALQAGPGRRVDVQSPGDWWGKGPSKTAADIWIY